MSKYWIMFPEKKLQGSNNFSGSMEVMDREDVQIVAREDRVDNVAVAMARKYPDQRIFIATCVNAYISQSTPPARMVVTEKGEILPE